MCICGALCFHVCRMFFFFLCSFLIYVVLLWNRTNDLSRNDNCSCVPMRERHECHCMLFLTEDNDFVGDKTSITYEEVIEKSGGMMT